MHIDRNHESPRSVRTTLAGLVAGAAVVCFGAPAFANPVTVTPAGDHFSAALSSGSSAAFTLGPVNVTCSHSTTTGSVPASPANHGDPVSAPITAPVFNNGSGNTCPTNLGVNATLAVSGTWNFSLDANASGGIVGTLTIPANGVLATAKIFGATCSATIAPGAPATLTGTWTNGTGGGKPKLVFSGSVPAHPNSGFPCPQNTSASLSISYDITDTTSSPPTQISVSAP